jgi:hypothetical protein
VRPATTIAIIVLLTMILTAALVQFLLAAR